jgi:hypothetical protein
MNFAAILSSRMIASSCNQQTGIAVSQNKKRKGKQFANTALRGRVSRRKLATENQTMKRRVRLDLERVEHWRKKTWFNATILALALRLIQPEKLSAENRIEYRYEDYGEDNHRMRVQTHSALFDTSISPQFALKGSFVYDGISGASPIGAPPPAGSDQVPVSTAIEDIRRAVTFAPVIRWNDQTITPQISYSVESDYTSFTPSLTYSREFNQKNTILNVGLSHDLDTIEAFKVWAPGRKEHKDNTDFLIGINQLLSPKTILTANASFGYTDGYLADPYKGAFFSIDYDVLGPTFGTIEENRPGHRFKQIGFFQLTQYIDPVAASIEPSYRIYHDDFGVISHTLQLTWWQKCGKHLMLGPMIRYYTQTAADFYSTVFAGDPILPEGGSPLPDIEPVIAPPHPAHYSSDYRLSELHTWTYGLLAHLQIIDQISLDLAVKRYEIFGDDHITSASAYPKAMVYTAGLGIWF